MNDPAPHARVDRQADGTAIALRSKEVWTSSEVKTASARKLRHFGAVWLRAINASLSKPCKEYRAVRKNRKRAIGMDGFPHKIAIPSLSGREHHPILKRLLSTLPGYYIRRDSEQG